MEKKQPEKNSNFKLKEKKDKTLASLSEVEYFLKNFKRYSNYIKLYKIIKK